jgi:5-methyltetrahydropteroyltriglutamate--homocysteine methyltransferase
MKQAVISASAMSLLYPSQEIPGYPREAFLADLIAEASEDIRGALDGGAATVQIDFTEARLSLKLDATGGLLRSFVALNNRVLEGFTPEERKRIGVHVCPGGDHDSTHSADIDYGALLPTLFELNAGRFYLQMASEPDRKRVLGIVKRVLRPEHLVFVGVIDPIATEIETRPRFETEFSKQLRSFLSNSLERQTIAASHPSLMMFPLLARPPSARFDPEWKEPSWRLAS